MRTSAGVYARYMLLLVSTLISTALSSTTIVIYITPRFVIMAADSKVVYTNVADNKESISVVSKIYHSNKSYFSLAGVSSNNTRNLNIARTVDTELKRFTNWTDVNARIKKAVTISLLDYISKIKVSNNKLYKQNLQADYFTSIGVIGLNQKKPYAHLFGFKVIDGKTVQIVIDEIDYGKRENKDAVYFLGQKVAINAYLDSVNDVTMAPHVFVEKLVQLQIKSTPALVGGPVDMIQITASGAKWLKRKQGTPVSFK